MSVCEVKEVQITKSDGSPMDNGINDLRMGTVDKSANCLTCGSNFADCPGHFGHIELVKPVFHVGFIEVCRKILRCICFNCSKLLAPKDQKYKEIIRNKNPKKRQTLMYNICKSIKECKIKRDKTNVNFFISYEIEKLI